MIQSMTIDHAKPFAGNGDDDQGPGRRSGEGIRSLLPHLTHSKADPLSSLPPDVSAQIAVIDARIAGVLQSLAQIELSNESADERWRLVLQESLAALALERQALKGD
jgi:hypothetical protein